MAQAIAVPIPVPVSHSRLRGSSPSIRTSLSPQPQPRPLDRQRDTRARSKSKSPQVLTSTNSGSTDENVPPPTMSVDIDGFLASPSAKGKKQMNGDGVGADHGNGGGRTWRDGSIEVDSDVSSTSNGTSGTKPRKNPPRSARPSDGFGLATLPTIPDPADEDENLDNPDDSAIATSDRELSPSSSLNAHVKPPPPALSTQTGTGQRPVMTATRRRRSSSVKRKLSPGVTPTKAVDWEIPRKTLHSSIGFFTLFLNYLNPPSLKPLLTVLSTALVTISTVDYFRLHFPSFAELWESYLGFLMRESERDKVNGVIWYLVGVIFVLGLYPRDVAVVAILTLSWSDTTASTIGRLWGKKTKPLPSHVPGLKFLPFAPRKSLAGFLAATVTGFFICVGFWYGGSEGRWIVLDDQHSAWGLWVTAGVVGLGGAVVEALDLGLDDNLTLPILSGALVWFWLSITNLLLA